MSLSDFDDLFGAQGPLAVNLSAYAPRREQITMCEAVAQAMADREALVVEAGTGTGKTFAYLVPALRSGRRVIISTGTRALQDQLYRRDLPLIAAAIGCPARVTLLKGRANYLCRHRLRLAREAQARPSPSMARALAQVSAWAERTVDGDVAGVTDLAEDSPVWPQVTSTIDNCLGQACPEYARCHVVAARREALAADIVIVNHHLLLADLVLKEEGFGELLPGADAVIVDEAHQFADTAARFFGVAVGSRQLSSLAEDVLAEAVRAGHDLRAFGGAADALVKATRDLRLAFGQGVGRVDWEALPAAAGAALSDLRDALALNTTQLAVVAGHTAGLDHCRGRATDLLGRLQQLLAGDASGAVRWAEVTTRGFTLRVTPVDVAADLASCMAAQPASWIFTSATLAVGDDFSHFCARVGLNGPCTLRLESPFPFRDNALLYLPPGLPPPAAVEHTERVIDAALPVLAASGGSAFLLFTSYRALERAAGFLRARLGRQPPFPLLVQGDAPRDELLRRFRAAGNAVLLGTGSFWEGVDVRGDALRVVVIDKLPFAAPDDPVLKARLHAVRKRGGNPFVEQQLPQAAIALKQGVGRLIRDAGDTGVVMLCDPRLTTRGYGRLLLASLPPMARTCNLDEVTAFLGP
ncbi:MAG TPA: ATP-dependent DNA helicase [Gammaproteobacteria bacterium]|nr:ATP-dependent DNA helicase [Gammaproteobacteria bacterium]